MIRWLKYVHQFTGLAHLSILVKVQQFISPSDNALQTVNLKGSAVELLEAMLEKTNEKSAELVNEIVNGLQFEVLHDNLMEFYELMNNPTVKDMGFDDEAEAGMFRTYHILVHLTDYGVPMEKVGESRGEFPRWQ